MLLTAVLIGSILFGQLFRIDLFSNSAGGLLVADVVAALVSLVFVVGIIFKKVALGNLPVKALLFTWFFFLILSYLVNVAGHTWGERVVGLGYLLRLIAYYFLIFVAYNFLAKLPAVVLRYLLYTVAILFVLGLVILWVLPNFAVLVQSGWDPHVDRLTSTWLDPNYFGTFLGLVFGLVLPFGKKITQKGRWWVIGYWITLLVLWAGVYLTASRSALLTLAIAGIVAAAFTSWRMVVFVLVLLGLTVALPSRLQSRVTDSVAFSVQQVNGSQNSSQGSSDPTASARITSWKKAIQIFKEKPVLGVGYNYYQYAQQRAGLLTGDALATNRSVAGSDSSLLTLLATTGILGLLAFLALWLAIILRLWKFRLDPYVLGVFAALIGWFISSFFNNTLLYAPILLPMILVTGVALARADA